MFRRRLAEAGFDYISVESAGTGSWHLGQGADPGSVAALGRAGYPRLNHTAKQFAKTWFDRFDLVLALDADNLDDLTRLRGSSATTVALLLDLSEGDHRGQSVPDPYGLGPREFDHVLTLCEEAASGLVARLGSGRLDL